MQLTLDLMNWIEFNGLTGAAAAFNMEVKSLKMLCHLNVLFALVNNISESQAFQFLVEDLIFSLHVTPGL